MPWLCERDGHEPIAHCAELARRFEAPRLRAPFKLEARRAAGFSEAELRRLGDDASAGAARQYLSTTCTPDGTIDT